MHEVAQERAGALKVYRLKTNDNLMTCVRLAVTSLPQLIYFVDGKEKARTVGLVPKARILAMLDSP